MLSPIQLRSYVHQAVSVSVERLDVEKNIFGIGFVKYMIALQDDWLLA